MNLNQKNKKRELFRIENQSCSEPQNPPTKVKAKIPLYEKISVQLASGMILKITFITLHFFPIEKKEKYSGSSLVDIFNIYIHYPYMTLNQVDH